MTHVLRQFYDAQVNALWPDTLPPLTGAEAERAAKRLYRVALQKPCKLPTRITSGRNRSYIRAGVLRVNPAQGWREFVHDLSHTFFARTKEGRANRPHSGQHASLERLLIRHVLAHGWLDGALRPAPQPATAKPSAPALRYARTLAAIARWEAKAKRAKTALAKLQTRRRYYERKGVAAP
jgi:hypothetical protein